MVAAHAVNSSARRGRRRAEVKIPQRSCILADTRSEKNLPHRHRPTADVASDKVGVPRLQGCRGGDMTAKNAIAETRSKALDLIFNPFLHIHARSEDSPIRHMTVSPRDVFARRSASRVEEARLRHQYKRPLGMLPMSHRPLRLGNLLERPADMDGNRSQAFPRPPGNRLRERIVNLKRAWSRPKP